MSSHLDPWLIFTATIFLVVGVAAAADAVADMFNGQRGTRTSLRDIIRATLTTAACAGMIWMLLAHLSVWGRS